MKRYSILIADDNFDDQKLIENAIRSFHPQCDLSYVYNGNQLLDYILKKGRYEQDTTMPHAIILDLKMPFLDGFGVLEALKTYPLDIPVYILSDTDSKKHDSRALRLGARACYTKPVHIKDFRSVIREIMSDLA